MKNIERFKSSGSEHDLEIIHYDLLNNGKYLDMNDGLYNVNYQLDGWEWIEITIKNNSIISINYWDAMGGTDQTLYEDIPEFAKGFIFAKLLTNDYQQF